MRLACMRSPRPTRAAPPAPRPDAAAPVVRHRVRYKLVEAAKLEEAKQAFESVTCHVYSVHAARPSSGEAMWSLNHQQDRGLYAKVPAAASPPALTVPGAHVRVLCYSAARVPSVRSSGARRTA